MFFVEKNKVFFTTIIFFLFSFTLLSGADKTVITVGYQPNTDLVYDLENMGREGIGYDLLKKTEFESDLQFEFVRIDGDIFDALENNIVDVIGLFLKTPERERKYVYSRRPLNSVVASLATKGVQGIFYDDPISLDGKTVATYEENPINKVFADYAREKNISVIYKVGDLETYLNLDADFYLTFSENRATQNFYSVLNLAHEDTYLITTHENIELMNLIDSAYSKMMIAEGFYFNELLDKYNDDSINLSHRELTRKEVEILRERPLIVGYLDNHRPFTYQDEEGNANGAIVELMSILAKKYGFQVEFIPYNIKDMHYEHEDFDIVISLVGSTDYEKGRYSPTESYYTMSMVATVPMAVANKAYSPFEIIQKTPRIGFAKYLYINFDKFAAAFPDISLEIFCSFEEMLESYKRGKIDMAVYTSAGSTYANAYLDGGKDYLFGTDFTLNFHFGVLNSIAETYVPIFNVMLDTITVREYDEILNRHTTLYYPEAGISNFLEDYWIYISLFILLLILAFFTYENRTQAQKQDLLIKTYQKDRLTPLMSMSYFYEKANILLSTASSNEYEVISFDIDYFRTINSYYSMEQGTEVIKEMANALNDAFENTSSLLARKTAEQFYVFRKTGEGGSVELLYENYILPSIRSVVGEHYKASLSFGSVVIENCTDTISAIIAYADYARMSGKVRHETTFIVYDAAMNEKFTSKLHITFKMNQAIKDKEFKVFYQPKIDFKSLKIVGAEALVRWIPANGDIIFPNEFIDVFEKNGFISTLDMYVFREVCHFINGNRNTLTIPPISVNLSSVTILEETLVTTLLDSLEEFGVSVTEVELEVTETAIFGSEELFLSKITELKTLGFTVSIDDFGSGVSSLNRLCAIDADVLKLDKAFFDQKEQNTKTSIVVDEVITLAKRLFMKIVAEGVETYEQAVWLRELNCDTAQGFYFSKPINETLFKQQLQTGKVFELKPD